MITQYGVSFARTLNKEFVLVLALVQVRGVGWLVRSGCRLKGEGMMNEVIVAIVHV